MHPDVESILTETAQCPPAWARNLFMSPCVSRVVRLAACEQTCAIDVSTGAGSSLVGARLPRAIGLCAESLQRAVAEMMLVLLESLRRTPCPHAVRMWNFVPGILARMGERVDRYRVFNLGRYDAFCEWYGGPESFAASLPAASAVGHAGDDLYIYVLGAASPGTPVENPRQIPAFGYSLAYGPRPPCFSRGTVARFATGKRLLVAGTASVRGEDSVHAGCLAAQFDETLENLTQLVRGVPDESRFSLHGIETARVYYPAPSDLAWLSEQIAARFPAHASVEFMRADICRRELLVEIEATIAPDAA